MIESCTCAKLLTKPAYHTDLNIDSVVSAMTNLFTAVTK
jgi:hypothetical protein